MTERAPAVLGQALAHACDCHIHINDPRYPYVPGADLHPPAATVADYRAVQQRLGTGRVVIVQPSSYGTDNRCTLDALAQFGPAARAVVVVDDTVTPTELGHWHTQGVRGVRFNLLRTAPVAASQMVAVAERIAPLGWHLQLHASADAIAALATDLHRLPVPVVFDHLGRLPRVRGEQHAAFGVMASLLDSGRAWVKLSGAELDGAADAPTYAPAAALAVRFLQHAPQRVVWGSNWPHPAVHQNGDAPPDDAALLRWLLAVAPTADDQRRILVSNPAALYGFDN